MPNTNRGKSKPDKDVKSFSSNRLYDNISDETKILKDRIDNMIRDDFSEKSSEIRGELRKMAEAVSMYSKMVLGVERRMAALENRIEGSINTIKFLFGGGIILTIINGAIMLFIALVSK